eukprot:jgi/Chlat1/7603/Chrsp64S07095
MRQVAGGPEGTMTTPEPQPQPQAMPYKCRMPAAGKVSVERFCRDELFCPAPTPQQRADVVSQGVRVLLRLVACATALLLVNVALIAATFPSPNMAQPQSKSLTVAISDKMLDTLKDGGYRLCIAKKLGDKDFNVIWLGMDDLLNSNLFEWQDSFQVFGQESFTSGALVRATTDVQDIQPGMTCVLTKDGNLMPQSGTPASTGPFYVDNQKGLICAGVNAMVNDEYKPFYVAKSPAILGRITLEPKETIMAFFDQVLTTSCMFEEVSGNYITLDYSEVGDYNVTYTDTMQWVISDPKSGKLLQILPTKRRTAFGEMDADEYAKMAVVAAGPHGPLNQQVDPASIGVLVAVVQFTFPIQPVIRAALSAYVARKVLAVNAETMTWSDDGRTMSFTVAVVREDPHAAVEQALKDAQQNVTFGMKPNSTKLPANTKFSVTVQNVKP